MIRIADLPVGWQEERITFAEKFVCDTDETPVINIEFSSTLSECHSVQYADGVPDHFLRSRNGDIILADKEWKNATSYYLSENDADYALPLAAICSRFSYHNALLVHSSFVKYQDKGVVFTGYSGVGKTTQAGLWNKYLGAKIVNGDKTFVREVDGGFFAYGLPWKGSSDYCLNEKAPLNAVVVLRQSGENRITRLNSEVTEHFMPHIFFPHWDKECLGKALDTFDRLLSLIPVYLLECRPDEESVMLTHDTIFG